MLGSNNPLQYCSGAIKKWSQILPISNIRNSVPAMLQGKAN